MTRQELSRALGNISPRHIQEAESYFEDVHSTRIPIRRIALIAAIIACFMTLTAFAATIFSAWNGDRLVMHAVYNGSGIVLLQITNQSDRDLTLEPSVKIYSYRTREPIASAGEALVSGRTIPANSTQRIRVDLRQAYDMEALEESTNEMYYLQVTNGGFLPGQKWNCMISFRTGDYIVPYYKLQDDSCLSSVLPSLQAYFYNYTPDIFARWPDAFAYMELVEAELSRVEGNIIDPVNPYLLLDMKNLEQIPHPGLPDYYNNESVAGYYPSSFDGYNKLMVRDSSIDIETVVIYLPAIMDDGEFSGGSVPVPIFYPYCYETYQTKDPDNCTFIRGNLLSFDEMEQYKVYEDDQYVCYNMTPLFYTDLRTYIDEMLLQRRDIYFDEIIWQRIESFYNYFSDPAVMGSHMYYLEGMGMYNENPLTLEFLREKGAALTVDDLEWCEPKTIECDRDLGLRYHIDGTYHAEAYMDFILVDGNISRGEEELWLIHDPTGDRCNLKNDDLEAFLHAHSE